MNIDINPDNKVLLHVEKYFSDEKKDESYQPVLLGERISLLEEGGITDNSWHNVKELMKVFKGPSCVELRGPFTLFWFNKIDKNGLKVPVVYAATGFAVGYMGTGPSKLAEILAELSMVEQESIKKHLCSLKQDEEHRVLFTV